MNDSRRALFKLALVVLLGLAAGVAMFVGTMSRTSAPAHRADVSALAGLITQNGQPFDPATLRGRYALVYFGFSYCPDACPTALVSMVSALKAIGEKSVQSMFVSVDPQRDTPAVLKNYLAHFGADIIGLTGSRDTVQRVLDSFGVIALEHRDDKYPNGYTMDHSNEFVLLSPAGKLEERIPGTAMPDQLTQIIRKHLEEGEAN